MLVLGPPLPPLWKGRVCVTRSDIPMALPSSHLTSSSGCLEPCHPLKYVSEQMGGQPTLGLRERAFSSMLYACGESRPKREAADTQLGWGAGGGGVVPITCCDTPGLGGTSPHGSCPASAMCGPRDPGRVVQPSRAPDGPCKRGDNYNSSLVVWRGLAKDTHVPAESQARNRSQLFMFIT